jgi:hypothetical protein
MRHNKLFSAAIALCVIAFFTMGWVASPKAKAPTPVTITGVYTGGALPNVTGTFTASGALEISGTSTMTVDRFANVGHCSQTLEGPDGSITILSNCQFSTMNGSWRIVSGTGAYENLQGNGRLVMTFPAGSIVVETFIGKID